MSELILKQNIFFKKILACMEEVIMLFEEIYPKYEKFINSVLYKYSGIGEFEDMKQDILITIAKKCQTIINPLSIKSWLSMVIRNYAYDKMRAKREKAQVISFSEITDDLELVECFNPENMLVDYKNPEAILEAKELKEKIERTIKSLKNPWKKVLKARHDKDLTYEQIGSKFGILLGTVKSQISRARERFREAFQDD